MRHALVRVALLAAALAACAGAPVRLEPPPAPDAIYGLWALTDGSTTVMRIDRAADPAALGVDAWAADSEVHFEVSGVAWDGKRLRATFRYPPSNVTTISELLLVNSDRLEGTVSGAYQAHETWLRTEAGAPVSGSASPLPSGS